MKTIVFLSAGLYNYFFPENAQSFGGVARIHRIVGWLSKNSRYNVKCIVGDYGQPRIQNRDGVTLIRCRINNPWNFFGIYALLRNIKPDLIAEFYPSARLFLLGALNRLHGQRFVYFTGSDIDVDGGYRQLTNALFYRLYVWGLGQADGIICQTENQKALLQKNYGLHGHVILSPYMRISDPVARKREYFLWVGRSNAYKRPDLFMDLAALMPDDNFVMICNPGQHGRDMYGEVSERAGRMPNMVFIQSVPPGKNARLLCRRQMDDQHVGFRRISQHLHRSGSARHTDSKPERGPERDAESLRSGRVLPGKFPSNGCGLPKNGGRPRETG